MRPWRAVQEALYGRFMDAWDGRTPVQLANEAFDPPDAPWAKVLVGARPSGPGTIGRPGNRKMDRAGAVYIMLREPPGDGSGRISDLAEDARQIFEGCRLDPFNIRFAQVDVGDGGDVDDGRWWGVTVEARFDYEEVK